MNERDHNLAEILAQEARATNADLETVVRNALTLYSSERQDAILELARELRPTYSAVDTDTSEDRPPKVGRGGRTARQRRSS